MTSSELRFAATAAGDAAVSQAHCRREERGVILIWAAVTVMLIAGVVMSGAERIRALDRVTNADWTSEGQAREVARAGLTDAYAWLRRQTSQPVASFAPQRVGANRPDYLAEPDGGWDSTIDMTGSPLNETDDPDKGLVRAFEISPGIWARYEVDTGAGSETFVDTNGNGLWDDGEGYTDANSDGKWNAGQGTRDLTNERGMNGTGSVWMIECTAEIFRRSRDDLPLGVGPNHRLARAKMAQEVRRLAISPPATSAICCSQGSNIAVGNRTRINGNGANALAYAGSTGSPSTGGSEIVGSVSGVPGYAGFLEDVFGVTLAKLKSMADISTSDSINGVPKVIPDYNLVVVDAPVTQFDLARPLRGTGVVIFRGDVDIQAGSNSFFNGLVYVQGDLTVRAPAYIRGTIIVTGDVDMQGTGGDYVEVDHDGSIVSHLLTKMGQYRIAKAPFAPSAVASDGRPLENGPGGDNNQGQNNP